MQNLYVTIIIVLDIHSQIIMLDLNELNKKFFYSS